MTPQPFVALPDTVQVEQIFKTNGGEAVNVYHVHNGNAIDDLSGYMDGVAHAINNWESTSGHLLRANDVTHILTRVRDMGQPAGLVKEYMQNTVGGVAFGSAPQNVTIALKWNTGYAGRSYRGRTYHVGLSYVVCKGDNLDPAIVQQFLDRYGQLLAAFNGVNSFLGIASLSQMVVVSKRHMKEWRLPNGTVTPITSVSFADTVLDSQRRRLAKRGA